MANFLNCITPVLKIEGGYTIDSGGETWKGVARRFWPQWKGWYYIDLAKKQPNWNGTDFKLCSHILSQIRELNALVIAFYETNFWNPIGGDNIKNEVFAGILVDSAVNEGIVPAIKRAQEIVHILQTGKIDSLLINKLNSL